MPHSSNAPINDFDSDGYSIVWTADGTTSVDDEDFAVDGFDCAIAEFDNSGDKSPLLEVVLDFPAGFVNSGSWDSWPYIGLYMIPTDMGPASDIDAPMPIATDSYGARLVASFTMAKFATPGDAQAGHAVVSLSGIVACKFTIQNKTGRPIAANVTNVIRVRGLSYAPA